VKDSSKIIIEENTIGYLRADEDSNNLLNGLRRSFSSKNGTSSEKKNLSYDELRDRRKRNYDVFDEQGLDKPIKIFLTLEDLEISLNSKMDYELIEEIGITGHEEVVRNGKTTIVKIS